MGITGRGPLEWHGAAAVAAALAAALVLGGCGGARNALGLNRTSPDEFAVVSKAPLVLPPNFALRPPMPGAPGPQQLNPGLDAQAALLNRPAPVADAVAAPAPSAPDAAFPAVSPGEAALLQAAGAGAADPDVRARIELEAAQIADRGRSFAERVLFWQQPGGPGDIIDPVAEADRLRAAGAAGLPPNVGLPEARRAGGLFGP